MTLPNATPAPAPTTGDPLTALQVFAATLTPSELDGARAVLRHIKSLQQDHGGPAVGAALKQWQADLDNADARAAQRRHLTVAQHRRATARPVASAVPASVTKGGWYGTTPPVRDLKAATAATDRDADGLVLWVKFLKFIDECVNKSTHEVRQNTMRIKTNPVFCTENDKGEINLDANGDPVKDNSNRLSAFYSAAQAKGILRRIGTEPSTDKRQSSDAKIYAVDMDLLAAARANLYEYAPKSLLPRKGRQLSGEVRAETPVTPVYNDNAGSLF